MKKTIFITCLALMPFFCLSQELIKEYDKNGNLRGEFYRGDNKKLTGAAKQYHENGKISLISFYKDGNEIGPIKQYNENGDLDIETIISKNPEENKAISTHYFPNGQAKEVKVVKKSTTPDSNGFYTDLESGFKLYYNNNIPFSGKYYVDESKIKETGFYKYVPDKNQIGLTNLIRFGVWKNYYEDGQLEEEVIYGDLYENGIPKSITTNRDVYSYIKIFSEDANVIEEATIEFQRNGKPLNKTTTYKGGLKFFENYHLSNGNISMKQIYKDDVLTSDSGYYDNGQLEYSFPSKEGKPTGMWKYFYNNGKSFSGVYYVDESKLKSITIYSEGNNTCIRKEYYENGKLKIIKHQKWAFNHAGGVFITDEGISEEYYENGALKNKKEFRDDKIVWSESYNQSGQLEAKSYSKNGQYHEEQVITKSKPANKSISEYVIGNTQLDRKIEKLFDDMYIKVSAKSFLGESSNFDALVIQGTNEIKKQVEGWIGGSLSSSQYQEFKQIQQKAEQKVSSALQMFSNLSSVSASQQSQSSENRNNSSNSKSTSSDVQKKVSSVFICSDKSKCCLAVVIMEGQGRAPSSGRCPGGGTMGHKWWNCGESGNKTFQCAD